MYLRMVLSILHFLCERDTWNLALSGIRDIWRYSVSAVEFNVRVLQSLQTVSGHFTAEFLCSLHRTDEAEKWRTAVYGCRVDILQSLLFSAWRYYVGP